MNNIKIRTKLIVAFVFIEVMLLVTMGISYSTASSIIKVDNPERYLSNFSIFLVFAIILLLGICTFITISLTKTIRKSLDILNHAADELALGKVDIKMEKLNDDEFGALIDDLQKVVDNIRYNAQIAQEVAGGNLTIEVHPKSDEDVMGLALRKLVNHNLQALSSIQESAYQVTTSSSQVASASEALAQGSTEQASAIEQITASITDIAEKTRENAAQANTAAELMAKTIEGVKKGNEEMQDMVDAMQAINKASEGISKIIKVIDDIAFQTNILALNAAVEAARAGDAGKGFAVVAEEVRNLAAKSSSAAAETAEMIEDSIQKVGIGSRIANETAESLDNINKVVKQSEIIINDIAKASNYQATAIAQIDQAIEQVSQVVQTNSATSEECAAASVELSNQASHVKDMLAVYRLKNKSGMNMGMGDNSSYRYESSADRNEQIISLKDGFGKY